MQNDIRANEAKGAAMVIGNILAWHVLLESSPVFGKGPKVHGMTCGPQSASDCEVGCMAFISGI